LHPLDLVDHGLPALDPATLDGDASCERFGTQGQRGQQGRRQSNEPLHDRLLRLRNSLVYVVTRSSLCVTDGLLVPLAISRRSLACDSDG